MKLSKQIKIMPAKVKRKREIKNRTSDCSVEKDKKVIQYPRAAKFVDSHFGFMKTKGKLLKALIEEKKRERGL